MSMWIALLLGVGAAAWAYAKLAHMNGNAVPRNNAMLAGLAGLLVFAVIFTLLKFTLNFS